MIYNQQFGKAILLRVFDLQGDGVAAMFSFASFMGDIILACQFLMVEINENKTSVVIKRCPGGNRTEVVIYTWWFRIFVERSSPFRKMSPLSNTPGKTNIEPAPVILPILHGTSEDCPNTVDLFQEVRIPSFHPSAGSAVEKTPWPLVLQRLSSGDVRILSS